MTEVVALPRGAKTHLREARRAYQKMKLHTVRGPWPQPPEYWDAQKRFLDHLSALDRLKVKQAVVAGELGISRPAVSRWLSETK